MRLSKKTFGDISSAELTINQSIVKQLFHECVDLIEHRLNLKNNNEVILYYFEGLTDGSTLKDNVIKPILEYTGENQKLFTSYVIAAYTKELQSWDTIIESLLEGQSILFLEGHLGAIGINTKGWAERSMQEPISESTIKGSHDGFLENVSKNIGLIRRYIPSVELKIKELRIGERATVPVFLIYLNDVANKTVIQEVESKIRNIHVDTIISIGELSHYISEYMYTPFPQTLVSERPDAIANQILDGKVAILMDRSPSAMVVPMNLAGFFHVPDDYALHWFIASFVRVLRFLGFFIATLLPAMYIAIVSFHFEVIPLDLYTSIAHSRIKVPFSPILEAIIMEITLEMLREASVRLPQPIGQTIGIVGGIVIGQAAVQAGIVSNIMVIIVSITAIASFIIPNYDLSSSIRFIRFPMMFFAFLYGIVGIVCFIMILIAHSVTLKSFGTVYTVPIAPFNLTDLTDTFLRFPTSMLTKRSSTGRSKQARKKRTRYNKGGSDHDN